MTQASLTEAVKNMNDLDDHKYFESLLSMINDEETSLQFKVNYLKYASTVDSNPDSWPAYTRNLLSNVVDTFHDDHELWDAYDPYTVASYAEVLAGLGKMDEMMEVVRYLENTDEVMKPVESLLVFVDNPVLLSRRLMILECLAGMEPSALDITAAAIAKLPPKSPVAYSAYEHLATAAADCYHLYPGMDRRINQIIQLINKSGDSFERKGTAGIVFRKFCMPSETRCASSIDAIRIAEKNFLPMISGDNLEKTFCFSQAAIALRGLAEKFLEMKMLLLKESDLYIKKLMKLADANTKEIFKIIRDMHLLRAYAQSGMEDQALEFGERFYGEAVNSINDFNHLMSQFGGFRTDHVELPEKLLQLKEETEVMAEDYATVYVNGLLFSGQFSVTAKLSEKMLGRLEKVLDMELPVMVKFKGLLDASEAYAFRNNTEDSLRLLKKAVAYAKRIPAMERREILVDMFTRTASEIYLYTGAPVFISFFMDTMEKEGIKGKSAEEAARFFADNLSALAFSRKLGIAFG